MRRQLSLLPDICGDQYGRLLLVFSMAHLHFQITIYQRPLTPEYCSIFTVQTHHNRDTHVATTAGSNMATIPDSISSLCSALQPNRSCHDTAYSSGENTSHSFYSTPHIPDPCPPLFRQPPHHNQPPRHSTSIAYPSFFTSTGSCFFVDSTSF